MTNDKTKALPKCAKCPKRTKIFVRLNNGEEVCRECYEKIRAIFEKKA